MKHKLYAFTLVEVLLVMVLSTIIAGTGYLSYNILQKQFLLFQSGSNISRKLLLLDHLLRDDINGANFITNSKNQLRLIRHDRSFILYQWNEFGILRCSATVRDSFPFPVFLWKTKWQKQEQEQAGFPIDELIAEIKFKKTLIKLCYQKTYSAEQFIDIEKNYHDRN